MNNMPLYLHFLYSSLATAGFAVFLNAPKSTLIPSGVVGGIGWTFYKFLSIVTGNNIISDFIATSIITFLSEFLARKLKQPAIIFIIPGIITLVPGLGLYNTMLYLVQKDYSNAISKGCDVLFVAGAISLGVLIISSLVKTFNLVFIKKTGSK